MNSPPAMGIAAKKLVKLIFLTSLSPSQTNRLVCNGDMKLHVASGKFTTTVYNGNIQGVYFGKWSGKNTETIVETLMDYGNAIIEEHKLENNGKAAYLPIFFDLEGLVKVHEGHDLAMIQLGLWHKGTFYAYVFHYYYLSKNAKAALHKLFNDDIFVLKGFALNTDVKMLDKVGVKLNVAHLRDLQLLHQYRYLYDNPANLVDVTLFEAQLQTEFICKKMKQDKDVVREHFRKTMFYRPERQTFGLDLTKRENLSILHYAVQDIALLKLLSKLMVAHIPDIRKSEGLFQKYTGHLERIAEQWGKGKQGFDMKLAFGDIKELKHYMSYQLDRVSYWYDEEMHERMSEWLEERKLYKKDHPNFNQPSAT